MTLGQRICALRTDRGLSQEELAQLLEVSRQSVSKWETDASLPELDKLLGLSRVFGVTLDELVNGPQAETAPQPRSVAQTVAGTILLCTGVLCYLFLVLLGGHPLFSIPWAGLLFFPGLFCLLTRRHTKLWCAWSVWLCIELYLCLATGLSWRAVLLTLQWTPDMNYVRLAVAWLMALVPCVLIVCTVRDFRHAPYPPKPLISISTVQIHPALALAFEWFALLLFYLLGCSEAHLFTSIFRAGYSERYTLYSLFLHFWNWADIGLLCVVLVHTAGFLRWRRAQKG